MIKLLGSVCVFSAGFWLRWMMISSRRRELDTLSQMLAALRQMETEIRMTRVPLPVLLNRLGDSGGPLVRPFFFAAVDGLQAECASPWAAAAEALPLSAQERATLQELGETLRGDEESVLKAVSLAASRLESSREEAESRLKSSNERTTALCFSASALLVILLI